MGSGTTWCSPRRAGTSRCTSTARLTVTRVVDDNGGSWQLAAPTAQGSSQVYASTVLASQPVDYWRLADSGGTTPNNSVHGGTATYNQVTLGADGAFGATDADKAATFNGTTSYLKLPGGALTNSGPLSAELWFNTSHPAGILLGSQEMAAGGPAGVTWCTPVLWGGTDSKLYAGVWATPASRVL